MLNRTTVWVLVFFVTACGPGCSGDHATSTGDAGDASADTSGVTHDTGSGGDAASANDGGRKDTATSDSGEDADRDAGGMDAADDGGTDGGMDVSTACMAGQNLEYAPDDTCQHGAAVWIAWKWEPTDDISVEELQLHTDDGDAALLDDDGGQPGQLLAQGTLSAADADGWRSISLSPPVSVTAGSTYWIAEDVAVCSTAVDGIEFEYYTADQLSGPWDGSFTGHSWTSKVSGTCP